MLRPEEREIRDRGRTTWLIGGFHEGFGCRFGKLGAPLVAVLGSKGLSVYGIDVNPDTVAQINAGRAPVQEPRLQEFLTPTARASLQSWVGSW
jgi:hypothetical protein